MIQDVHQLAEYRDKYQGSRAILVGSGPTEFDYTKLQDSTDPIFFINDALFVIPEHNANHFIYTHHQNIERWWYTGAVYIKWLPVQKVNTVATYDHHPSAGKDAAGKAQPRRYVAAEVIRYTVEGPKFPFWSKDKDFITENRYLHVHSGSVTGMIHFMYYCGCKDVLGVGINPNSGDKHDPRIDSNPCPGLRDIIRDQLAYFEHFDMSVEYV